MKSIIMVSRDKDSMGVKATQMKLLAADGVHSGTLGKLP